MTVNGLTKTEPTEAGQAMYDLMAALYPICRSITGDGVAAKGVAATGFGFIKPVARLEPLAIAVDEAHQRDRGIEAVGGEPGDDVQFPVGYGIDHAQIVQRRKAGLFIRQNRREGWVVHSHCVFLSGLIQGD